MKMLALPKETLRIICNNISYIDVVALRWTCKPLSKMPNPSFKDRFMKKLCQVLNIQTLESNLSLDKCDKAIEDLKNIGTLVRTLRNDINIENDPSSFIKRKELNDEGDRLLKIIMQHFCLKLDQCGGYVAGSFILDCLYDTNNHNDIDVFFITDSIRDYNLEDSDDYYGLDLWSNCDRFSYYISMTGFKHMNERDLSNKHEVEMKKLGYYDPTGGSKTILQIIGVPIYKQDLSLSEFIDATFDMDIVKSRFDGNKLTVINWNKLVERYDQIICTAGLIYNMYTPNKNKFYLENNPPCGWCKSSPDDKCADCFKLLCQHETDEAKKITLRRKEKYIGKGFNITDHPKMDEIIVEVRHVLDNRTRKKISYVIDRTINLHKYSIN
jgi:hypothetical protein